MIILKWPEGILQIPQDLQARYMMVRKEYDMKRNTSTAGISRKNYCDLTKKEWILKNKGRKSAL